MAKRDKEHAALWDKATKAGIEAAHVKVPTPMIVTQHASPLDDTSEPVKQWYVAGGVCGFAEVRLPKGNTSFARWAKKNAGFKTHYYGGMYYWVSGFGQSMETKLAFATAAADVLVASGLDAYADSRLD